MDAEGCAWDRVEDAVGREGDEEAVDKKECVARDKRDEIRAKAPRGCWVEGSAELLRGTEGFEGAKGFRGTEESWGADAPP